MNKGIDQFKKLGIAEPVLKAIRDEGFSVPTEIQSRATPAVIDGVDVIAGAATGSGKTLVFAAGIIKNTHKDEGLQALVLAPTRELAEQVTKALRVFAKYKRLRIVAVYGGVSIERQIENLKRAEVVVATPGRLIDHMNRGTVDLSNVRILVLDEADRMLDMGFLEDVELIINACPKNRQTLLFSATITHDVAMLAQRYMKSPVKIMAESYVSAEKLKQVYYDIKSNLKFSLLVHLLKHEDAGLVMVFCNTRRNVDFVMKNLKNTGIDAVALHGGYSQEKRDKVMKSFHLKHSKVLVCTDLAARGLDINGVTHIYNYDIPSDSKQYVHRVGRTARAGNKGKAITLLSERDYENFRRILRENVTMSIDKLETPYVERVRISWREEIRNMNRRFNYGERRFGGKGFGRDYRRSNNQSNFRRI